MRARHFQSGLSLIELMISMTLGLVLMSGMLQLFLSAVQSSRHLTSAKQLEDELHGTLDLIMRDLRRSGAMGNPLRQFEGYNNPFGLDTPSAYTGEPSNSCLTQRYDYDGDGGLDTSGTDERFGYRIKSGVVEMRVGGQACTVNTSPVWSSVTTLNQVQITGLQFSTTTNTTKGVMQRYVTVTLSGRLAADTSVSRSVTRSVRVRNDGYAQ